MKSPRAHRDATLLLFDRFAALTGSHPQAAAVRDLIAATELPAAGEGMKHDLYLAAGASTAWGATINDRWEPALLERAARLGDSLGHDLAPCRRLRAAVAGELTLAFGFDTPERPLRLKAYVQEARWGVGVGTVASLAPLLAEHGCAWPAWVAPSRSVGVLALALDGGAVSIKAYLGGTKARDAAAGAPREAALLAEAMAAHSPLTPSYHYLTLRLAAGREPRYAINKIYEVGKIARGSEAGVREAWTDVQSLFVTQGRVHALASLFRALVPLADLRVVPTATALERASADVYCAAWPRPTLRG
jgi:hypothetical protein